jgi:hypothetical protein
MKLQLPLAAAVLALLSCGPRLAIVSPADLSQADASGDVPVVIDLAFPLGEGSVTAHLLRGIDGPSASILPVALAVDGTTATATLTAADLLPGRHTLYVHVDRDANGQPDSTATATFSWEPALDAATLERCDPLDPARCLFPFPSDHFTVADPSMDSGRRVDFDPASMPGTRQGLLIDPTEWNRNDGFSPGPKLITVIPGVDLVRSGAPLITRIADSLAPASAVVLIDAETGERQLAWAEMDPEAADMVIVRVGKNLQTGRRYIVALRHLKDAQGAPLAPGRAFRLYRDRIPTFLADFEARRPHMEEIFTALAGAGVARSDLHLAWDFTVISKRNLSERMLKMRDESFASLAAAAPSFAVTSVEEDPNSDGRVARRISGTFRVPLYLTGSGEPGSRLLQGPDGLPVRSTATDFDSPFRCILPKAASAESPSRIVLYGHGLLGSQSEVNAANLRRFAEEHNITFCATRWHGMSEDDVVQVIQIVQDLSRFPTLSDRLHQGMLSFLFLGRAMLHPEGLASHPAFQDAEGRPLIDTSDLFYDGNSQGAIAGGGLAAFAQDYTRAVLGVPGMNYSTLLRRSVDFDTFFAILRINYDDPVEIPLNIALIQMLWDRVETNGHAGHLTADTYPGTPPKKILLHVAFSDHQVANVSAEVEARTIGARIHQPALLPGRHHDEQIPDDPDNEPYFGIEPLPAEPYDGSAIIIWDSGTPTPPTGIFPPRSPEYGRDPHETPRCMPEARIQKSEFLRSDGAVIDVCNGGPCLAVDPPPCLPSP